jgi:hypothetical protein
MLLDITMARRVASVGLLAALVGVSVSQRLGRTAGSTVAGRRATLPGDDLVQHPMFTTNHAISNLVLHSRSHLPPGFRDRWGAWIDWSWVFVLHRDDERSTRFIFRSRARIGPPWLAAAYWLLLIPADFVMSRQMLRGIQRRVASQDR